MLDRISLESKLSGVLDTCRRRQSGYGVRVAGRLSASDTLAPFAMASRHTGFKTAGGHVIITSEAILALAGEALFGDDDNNLPDLAPTRVCVRLPQPPLPQPPPPTRSYTGA